MNITKNETVMSDTPYRQRVEEMQACIGNNIEHPNYVRALTILNDDSHLRMDSDDLLLMNMVYSVLSQSRRFGGEEHLAAHYHSNSAAHSIFSVVRMNEIVRHAIEDYGATPGKELTDIVRKTGRGLLMHDVGESFGEWASVAQSAANPSIRKDIPEIEHMVTEYTLSRAAYALQTNNLLYFLDGILPLREKFAELQATGEVPAPEMFRTLLAAYPVGALSKESTRRVKKWMDAYELMEHKNDFETHFGKSCEHVEGTRYLLRFGEEGAKSFGLMTSKRALANPKYTESNLGDMFEKAGSSPLKLALADSMRDIAYETGKVSFEEGPAQIDRSTMANAPANGNEPLPAYRKHPDKPALPQIVDRDTMTDFYDYAIRVGYRPRRKEILALTRELPDRLSGFSSSLSVAAYATR